jgi:hypothetical protein
MFPNRARGQPVAKKQVPQRKRRTREHVLADLSAHHGEGHALRCRAYALLLLQNTIASEDFFEKIRVERGREPLLRNAQLGRVSLQEG